MLANLGDHHHVRWGRWPHERRRLRLGHLQRCCGRRVHLHGQRPAEWLGGRRDHGRVGKGQLHDLGQRAHTRQRSEVLVLRLGKQLDLDPADHELDPDGHGRAPEGPSRWLGRLYRFGRDDWFGRHNAHRWGDRRWWQDWCGRLDGFGRRNGCGRCDGRWRCNGCGRLDDAGRSRALRHLCGCQPSNTVCCGVQYDSSALEIVHRAPLPGQERGRQPEYWHGWHDPGYRVQEWLR